MVQKLPPNKARMRCPKNFISCESTESLEPLVEIIGQDRAILALQFGLDIKEEGFNIYVAGMPGTGKKTAIVTYLEERAKTMPVPNDWCYVNDFQDGNKPNALSLPSGYGIQFRDDMDKFVEDMKKALVQAFESDDYANRREEVVKEYEDKKSDLWKELNKKAGDSGFVIQRSQIGMVIVPVINGQIITDQQFNILPQNVKDDIQDRRKRLQDEMRSAFRQLRDVDREAEEAVLGFNKEVASFALDDLFAVLKDKYNRVHECTLYLDSVKADILDHLDKLLGSQRPQQPQIPFLSAPPPDPTIRYKVNLVVDNSKQVGAPVIMELNPTHDRLFGLTEKEARFGALITNYTMIRAGSAHRANGGYLIIPVEDIFRTPGTWESLKRTIVNKKLEIEDLASRMGFISTRSLRPEPIPFTAKVILVGDSRIYQTLFSLDRDFKKVFKVKAEFDIVMERNEENVNQYAQFMCTVCNKEGLKHLDSSAIAAIVEYSSRLASDQDKLSTRFSEVSDIIREANFYTQKEGENYITDTHVRRAIESKIYRSNLIEEKLGEMIERGTILVDTQGFKAGQVNGLAVLGLGDIMFGKPSRITASVGVGKGGIIDIERESMMGGPTHTKGVHILTGFLTHRYAKNNPLSLTARLVFEQSYSGVDGDSASSTETYALLSALSGVPIQQSFAVTGSVNQKGEVQAIGGVNHKIEGFFALCKFRGLDGNHGIVIPESNVKNLMLKEEVVEAIKDGKFNIYPVKTIDEGIEILTGIPAGEQDEGGNYPEGTINYLVQNRLSEMAELAKNWKA